MTPLSDRPPYRRMVVHIGARRQGEPGWKRDYPISGSLREAQDDADRNAASYGGVEVFIADVGATPETWWRRPAGGAWEEFDAQG